MPSDTLAPDLPAILAGPLLRRLEERRLVLWLVASRPIAVHLQLAWEIPGQPAVQLDLPLDAGRCERLPAGAHAWLYLIDVADRKSVV